LHLPAHQKAEEARHVHECHQIFCGDVENTTKNGTGEEEKKNKKDKTTTATTSDSLGRVDLVDSDPVTWSGGGPVRENANASENASSYFYLI
jgi:hypothetical protein